MGPLAAVRPGGACGPAHRYRGDDWSFGGVESAEAVGPAGRGAEPLRYAWGWEKNDQLEYRGSILSLTYVATTLTVSMVDWRVTKYHLHPISS